MPVLHLRFPYSLQLCGRAILLHGIFEFIGIFLAFRYYLWLKKKQGDILGTDTRKLVIVGAALGAVLGMRIVGALEDLPAWMASPSPWLYFYGNKTLVGGLLGGVAGVELVKKIIGEKQHTGDLFVFPLILGMCIGRLGCFSAGIYEETYGVPTRLPWSMNLGDGITRHPVTVYELLFLLLAWRALLLTRKYYVVRQGGLFQLFLIGYLVFRFLLDFIKPGWRYACGLGTIHLACLTGLLYYARYIVKHGSLILSKRTHAR